MSAKYPNRAVQQTDKGQDKEEQSADESSDENAPDLDDKELSFYVKTLLEAIANNNTSSY